MKKLLKIIATLAILIVASYYFLMAIAIGSSSHSIPDADRRAAGNNAEIVMIVGALLIIAVWMPWKKILGGQPATSSHK